MLLSELNEIALTLPLPPDTKTQNQNKTTLGWRLKNLLMKSEQIGSYGNAHAETSVLSIYANAFINP